MYIPYSRQAVIGADNVLTQGTLSASSSPEGGEAENAIDGFTYDYWQPGSGASPEQHWLAVTLSAPAPVDYLAIHAHNLPTVGGDVSLEASNDGTTWTLVAGPYTPASAGPQLYRFTSVTYSQYRFNMTGSESKIAVVSIGEALVLPEGIYVGHAPATLNRATKIMNQKSDSGQLLGRSLIREGARGMTIEQDHVSPEWVRDTWQPFALAAEFAPFFFAWRTTAYPLEVMYAWGSASAEATHSKNAYMKISLEIEGQA